MFSEDDRKAAIATLQHMACATDEKSFREASPSEACFALYAWYATDAPQPLGHKARPMWLALQRDAAEAARRLRAGDVLHLDTGSNQVYWANENS